MPKTMSRAQLNALPTQCRATKETPSPTLFVCNAYALGQFCLPYFVPVTRRATRRIGAH